MTLRVVVHLRRPLDRADSLQIVASEAIRLVHCSKARLLLVENRHESAHERKAQRHTLLLFRSHMHHHILRRQNSKRPFIHAGARADEVLIAREVKKNTGELNVEGREATQGGELQTLEQRSVLHAYAQTLLTSVPGRSP